MFQTLKNKLRFGKPNYKSLYENELQKRKELEEMHRVFCKEVTNAIEESKKKFSLYKATDSGKEF